MDKEMFNRAFCNMVVARDELATAIKDVLDYKDVVAILNQLNALVEEMSLIKELEDEQSKFED